MSRELDIKVHREKEISQNIQNWWRYSKINLKHEIETLQAILPFKKDIFT
jgi:hypothetical protein